MVGDAFAYAQRGGVGVFQVSATCTSDQSADTAGAAGPLTAATNIPGKNPVSGYPVYAAIILGITALAASRVFLGRYTSRVK